MAAEKDSTCHNNCVNDPNFAIICSFFDRFSNSCRISHPTFSELQEMIEDSQEVSPGLIDLHVKLLRKIRKSVAAEKWERALIKFCHTYYCSEEGWELERGGYKKCKAPARLKILKTLLDAQFDLNVKFKNDINKLTAEELRIEPLGRDKVGHSYWCQFDAASNVKVYKEDQDEETWKLMAKDREGLVDLITQLSSGEGLLGLEVINEDSNSQEVEKPITDTGQVDVSTSEENTADNFSSSDNIENGVKQEHSLSSNGQTDDICMEHKNATSVSQPKPNEESYVQNTPPKSPLQSSSKSMSTSNCSDDIQNLKLGQPKNQKSEEYNQGYDQFIDDNSTIREAWTDSVRDKGKSPEKNHNEQDPNVDGTVVTQNNTDTNLIKLISMSDNKSNKLKTLTKLDEILGYKSYTENEQKPVINQPSQVTESESNSQQELYSKDIEKNVGSSLVGTTVKRKLQELEHSNESNNKRQRLEIESNVIVGDEIEEPLMLIKGEGSGKDCDTGNPGREGEENDGQTERFYKDTSSSVVDKSVTEGGPPTLDNSHSNVCNNAEKVSDNDVNTFGKGTNSRNEAFASTAVGLNDGKQSNNSISNNTDSLNGSNYVEGMKDETSNTKIINTSFGVGNTKSIEEQMSFLTGQSLSPLNVYTEEDTHENSSEKSVKCTVKPRENEALMSKDNKAKIKTDKCVILGSLATDSNNSYDVLDTLTGKADDSEKRQINNLDKNDTAVFTCTDGETKQELKKRCADYTLVDKQCEIINKFDRSSNKLGSSDCENVLASCKTELNPIKNIKLEGDIPLSVGDECVSNIDKEMTSITNNSLKHTDALKENVKLNVGDKVSTTSNSKEREVIKSGSDINNSNDVSVALNSDGNVKTSNKKQKKIPKPRKKLFTPKSRKKAAKVARNVIEKTIADHPKDNTETNKNEDLNENDADKNNLKNKEKNEHTTGTSLYTKGSRKRKNVKRNTEMVQCSEAGDISDTKPDEECAGGKKPKVKGKTISNKELNKIVEDKHKVNSSSEEESSGKKVHGKNIKKCSYSPKQKVRKRKKGVKNSEEKKDKGRTTKILERSDEESNETKEIEQPKKKAKSQGRNSRAFLGIDLNINIIDSGRSVRQSSRLAQIKIKEQVDSKIAEESNHKSEKSHKKSTKKKGENEDKQKWSSKRQKAYKSKSSEEDDDNIEGELAERKKRRKKKKNPVKAFNERDPWKSSSGSSSDVEEDDEEYHFDDVEEEEEPMAIKSDHEFSPESDLETDSEAKPIRHARTAQKDPATEEGGDTDDFACEKCGKKDHPEWILLCDTCDRGWHASCLRPSLMLIPEGDWHCPPCNHAALLKKLQETLKTFDRDSKRRENEELRRKRLAYVGISLDNVLPNNVPPREEKASESSESSESVSESEEEVESDEPVYQLRQRRQGTDTYRFSEYDELINSAIQDEVAGKCAGFTTFTDNTPTNQESVVKQVGVFSNENKVEEEKGAIEETKPIVSQNESKVEENADKPIETKEEEKDDKTSSEDEGNNEDEDYEEEFPHVVPKRINTLPRPGKKKHRRLNCLDDPSDDDDGSDEDFKGSSSDEEDEDDEEEDSDESGTGRRRPRRGHNGPVRRSSRTRRARFDKEFINDDSEESDTPKRKKTRKMWSDSDSESDDSTWGRRKKKKNQGTSGRRKKKKNKKFTIEDELSETEVSKVPKKKRQRKIKYGGLDDLAVEDLPSRRTRGKKINYQEVLASDSDEEFPKRKNFRKAVIQDDEDEFVAEEEKEETECSSGEGVEEEGSSAEEGGSNKEAMSSGDKQVKKQDTIKPKAPTKHNPRKRGKVGSVKKVIPAAAKAMIAPPPERLVSEDEQYKAIVSKVPAITQAESSLQESNTKSTKPIYISDHSNSSEFADIGDHPHNLTPITIPPISSSMDTKFTTRSPPIKIRSGVPVNANARSPLGSDVSLIPINTINHEPIKSPPPQPEKGLGITQAKVQQFLSTTKHLDPTLKLEKSRNEDIDIKEEDEDYLEDIEEEEEDDDEDDSEAEFLEEGEIPKKVAKRMARIEEQMEKRARRNTTDEQAVTANPAISQPPTSSGTEQKPLLRVVSPLKLMANPPGHSFIHSSPPRMPMGIRPSQPATMMPVMAVDESPKKRGRGRGKKQPEKPPDQEIVGGASVIRGMLQQPQSYPPSHYPQQFPPHLYSPQRATRPPFHHPLDPSPSGGSTVTIKQETPPSIPSKPPPQPFHHSGPPPHRFEPGHLRPSNYPPQYNSYPPPSANYHYGNYPPPQIAQRDEYPPYSEPSMANSGKTYNEDDTGEFGGLVSYFSSQREEELDT